MNKLKSIKDRKIYNIGFKVNETDLKKIEYYLKENNLKNKSDFFYKNIMNVVDNFCQKDKNLFEVKN